jgi:phosphotriesterase-related protein
LIAQQEMVVPLNIHPGCDLDQSQNEIDTIRRLGYPVERVVINHIDRMIFDDTRLLPLANSGCVIKFDLFSQEQSAYPCRTSICPPKARNYKTMRTLPDHSHGQQVLISHDIRTRSRLRRHSGPEYHHILEYRAGYPTVLRSVGSRAYWGQRLRARKPD